MSSNLFENKNIRVLLSFLKHSEYYRDRNIRILVFFSVTASLTGTNYIQTTEFKLFRFLEDARSIFLRKLGQLKKNLKMINFANIKFPEESTS